MLCHSVLCVYSHDEWFCHFDSGLAAAVILTVLLALDYVTMMVYTEV